MTAAWGWLTVGKNDERPRSVVFQELLLQPPRSAIDRKTIVARVFENRFTPAYTFIHPSQFGYDASVKQWSYDPKAARALLAEAGFRPGPDGILLSPTGQRFSLDLTTTAGNTPDTPES